MEELKYFEKQNETSEASCKDDNCEGEIPLNTSWTLWMDKSEKDTTAEEYAANLTKVYKISTVEGFWRVINNIPDIQELKKKYGYHLMRGDLRPIWEDEGNREGGSYNFKCGKNDSPLVWRELLLAAIGEQFGNHVAKGDLITGISVTVREKDDVIQVWNSNATLNTECILKKIKDLVPETKFITEFYRAHQNHRNYKSEVNA